MRIQLAATGHQVERIVRKESAEREVTSEVWEACETDLAGRGVVREGDPS
jgi:hypothetical protein